MGFISVNLLGENLNATKRNTVVLLNTCKEFDPELSNQEG
jgi:hypothetical protein